MKSLAKTATLGTAATAALFSLPHEADAAVVYSGIKNITVTAPSVGNHFTLLNVNSEVLGDLRINVQHGTNSGLVVMDGVNATQAGVLQQGSLVRKLASGSVIFAGAVGGFSPEASNRIIKAVTAATNGLWASGVDALAGFRFNNAGGPLPVGLHYGWIRLHWNDKPSYGNTDPASFTVVDWAVESTPNAAIAAGATGPEPSSALLALAGLGGLALVRRRAAKKA